MKTTFSLLCFVFFTPTKGASMKLTLRVEKCLFQNNIQNNIEKMLLCCVCKSIFSTNITPRESERVRKKETLFFGTRKSKEFSYNKNDEEEEEKNYCALQFWRCFALYNFFLLSILLLWLYVFIRIYGWCSTGVKMLLLLLLFLLNNSATTERTK